MKKLILILLSFFFIADVFAEDNTLGMDSECYRFYQAAREHAEDESCLIYLDSLIAKGEELADTRAVTLGYQLLMGYYVRRDDEAMMLRTASEARAVDLRYGSDIQYFMTYRVMVKYYLDRGCMLDALDVASEMQHDPHTAETVLGQYSTFHTMATICSERGMVRQAREYYSKAIEAAKSDDIQSMAIGELYTRLAELYPMESDSCRLILTEAERFMTMPVDTFHIYSTLALSSALRHDSDEYRRAIGVYEEYFSRFSNRTRGKYDVKAQIAKAVAAEKWKDAYRLCDSLNTPALAGRVRLTVADMSGDPYLARMAADKLIAYSDSLQDVRSAHDLEDMSMRFERTKAEKLAMKSERELEKARHSQRRAIALAVCVLLIALMSLHMNSRNRRLKEEKRLNATLKKASDMKTNFVHNISHEIRTPLNAILGFSQLLALPDDFVTAEERKQYGEYIANNGQLLLMLVNDILSLSDVEQGRMTITNAPTDIHGVIESSINSVRDRVPDGVRLYSTTDCPVPCMVNTDALRVQQVLINFLTNACKNTSDGEIHVHTSLSENPDCLTISVADTGCGVDPAKAEAIFDRFTKLDEFKQGNGLGLNLCRQISENLNGRVYLDTTYKGGARFVFALPTNNH